jgi:hypothetical protein
METHNKSENGRVHGIHCAPTPLILILNTAVAGWMCPRAGLEFVVKKSWFARNEAPVIQPAA